MLRSSSRAASGALLVVLLAVVGVVTARAGFAQTASPSALPAPASTDPYLWLEDVNGDRSMAWVRAENAKTLAVLEKDPRFAALSGDALKIAEAKDRVAYPRFVRNDVYNFWQDAEHVRGIFRETSLSDYQTAAPAWQTVLDLDALAKAEKANWVFQGADCGSPEQKRCLLSLSDGGEDAATIREFDLGTRSFPSGGFNLPHGKQTAAWESADSLLVAREWTPGEMTSAGYPYVVKRLRRGQPLSAAVEVFRGSKSDTGSAPVTFDDGGRRQVTFIERSVTFFASEFYLAGADGVRQLGLPAKAELEGIVDGRLLIELKENWTADGATFAAGSLVSVNLAALARDPMHPKPVLVYAPGKRESLAEVATTKSRAVIVTYENVRGRAYVYAPQTDGTWSKAKLDLPDNSAIGILSSDEHTDDAFLYVTGFLTPTTVVLANAVRASAATVKTSPARFDAAKDLVEQFEATSKDGTKIPYFVVHPKAMTLDGSNPTILNAYGGFQISSTPYYSGFIGKLWLERGGAFALANIRGGGEFGPAWHEAALKTHRQTAFDDFASVAQDLIARKITSPRRLGIQGGSNGGLLMGVEFTQHPELYRAVDIQVPLLDMLRYEQLAAGASWVGEYGSVSVPQERAFLASISPYENLRAGVNYPEPFIWTTTKDDRVGPQQARKFAAKLSALGVPYLFYEVIEGGHGSGANLNEEAHTSALEFMYFIQKLMD